MKRPFEDIRPFGPFIERDISSTEAVNPSGQTELPTDDNMPDSYKPSRIEDPGEIVQITIDDSELYE